MYDFILRHQLDMMLSLSSICGITAFFAAISTNISRRRKLSMLHLELSAMLILIFDRYTYIFNGDTSTLGYYMVRISHFMVFFLSMEIVHAFNLYIVDIFKNEGALPTIPKRLCFAEALIAMGEILVIVSQFTNLFYSFDKANVYHRGEFFVLSYVTPLLALVLDLSVLFHYRRHISKRVCFSLILFAMLPMVSAIVQYFWYGISLTNITSVGVAVLIYFFSFIDLNEYAAKTNREELESIKMLFEQTVKALVSAIDFKDRNTHGHSSRVADYAKKIAKVSGKSEKECDEIYYAALLHDVGKIGIPDYIINKSSELTDDEYDEIKTHTIIGKQILSSISEFPYLSVGANYHHERYDGRGYPDKLKGEDIPEIARIIAVADAYDVMTSKRQYRDPVPQELVREEIIKGSGSQFDPKYAKVMLHLMDMDSEYDMKEKAEVKGLSGRNELHPDKFRSEVSEGILVNSNTVKIHLRSRAKEDARNERCLPAIILFDSLDGRIHTDEKKKHELWYYESGEIWFDGKTICKGARKIQRTDKTGSGEAFSFKNGYFIDYEIEAVKYEDHALIRISSVYQSMEFIVALADSSRFLYISLTGEYCDIIDVAIDRQSEAIGEGYIPRIADKISYIDVPSGHVPNIQIDGYHYAITEGVPVKENMKITFHAMSLPTARLIWHCPHIILFYSDDKKVNGPNYREFALIRLDGEYWESDGAAENRMTVNFGDEFTDWDDWKEKGKAGYDCTVDFVRNGNTIVTTTKNLGVDIRNITKVKDDAQNIYVALTGDQAALTNIRYL